MWDLSRVWPIVCEFGFGAVLMGVGLWAGWKAKYLDSTRHEDRLLVLVLVGGYLILLALYAGLTLLAPLT